MLSWSPSPDTDITNYSVYCSTNGWPNTNSVIIQTGTNCEITLSHIQAATYYFAATCQNSSGIESDFSNVLTWKVPSPPTNMMTLILQYGTTLNSITNPIGFFDLKIGE